MFWGKGVKHVFSYRESIPFKKKKSSILSCCFNVTVAPQSNVHNFSLFRAWKLSAMNSSQHKHVLFDQLW